MIQTLLAFAVSGSNHRESCFSSSRNYHHHHRIVSSLQQFTTSSSSEFDKDYSKFHNVNESDDDASAKSEFGTKSYWDMMYEGMGDFRSDEYSWYYGYEVIKPLLEEYVLLNNNNGEEETTTIDVVKSQLSILLPGCGNDPLILDLCNAGYHSLTAFDYSAGAIDRQNELLEYLPIGSDMDNVNLSVQDARSLPKEWEQSYDVIIEKGALDAIYLSDADGKSFIQSVQEFERVIKPDGICISCSGVVSEELRREGFAKDEWDWLRDGSDDLKAGSFILRRRR